MKKNIFITILIFLSMVFLQIPILFAEDVSNDNTANNTTENNINVDETSNNTEDNVGDNIDKTNDNQNIESSDNISNDTTTQDENTDNVDSNVLEYIKDRTERLETKIGINQETNTEKEADTVINDINNKELEKSILEEVGNILNQKTLEITKDLQNKETTLSKLNEELLKEKEKLIINDTKIKELETQIANYKKSIESKEKLIIQYKEQKIITDDKIKNLDNKIQELSVYKKKYEDKIKKEKDEAFTNMLKNVAIYFGFVIIYFLIYLFFQKRKEKLKEDKNYKRLNRLVIVEVLIGIAFVLFTIIYIIIINPGIGIVFVIMGGSIIVSIRPIIASFISSFNVITNYKLGDKIEVNKQFGEIKSINLLTTTLKLYDKSTLTSLNKTVKVPNTFFSEKEVIRYRRDEFLKTFIIKVNFKDLTKNLEEFFMEIDNLFFKENIEIINNIQKKRYFLSIKGTGNQEFEFEFKYKDKDGTSIDKKIIEYIQSIIKIEDDKKDKENDDTNENEKNKEK